MVLQVYVGEPNVPDTIQILRGLKEKYEDHHGVHITDRALVVAAELSDRYITARFLPDKVRHKSLWFSDCLLLIYHLTPFSRVVVVFRSEHGGCMPQQ